MAMRLEQVQKQAQKLVMSTQMQQAIQLLQLPLMDLMQLLRQEMAANPVLEEITAQDSVSSPKAEESQSEGPEVDFDDEFSRLSKLDDEWKEYFSQAGSFTGANEERERKRRYYEDSIAAQETLHEHLIYQLNLSTTSAEEKKTGERIIGCMDENGYLTASLEELVDLPEFTPELLERSLVLIQSFHPPGVGARSLRECLLLQLERLGKTGTVEAAIISNHLEDLGKKNLVNISKALGLGLPDIQKACEFISKLEPKPGRIFDNDKPQYVTPDITVERTEEGYAVIMNDERIPQLRISNLYRSLMKSKDLEGQTKDYIRNKIQSARWLIKNILLRQHTIYSIAQTIVEKQRAFFDSGMSGMKPMTMQEVASEIGVHESTVSRAIAGKYMETPRGLFSMKYFFTHGLQTSSGEDISTINIKNIISEAVSKEDPANPLSDSQVVEVLKTRGIELARRTVTKYRKALKILPSNLRKKF